MITRAEIILAILFTTNIAVAHPLAGAIHNLADVRAELDAVPDTEELRKEATQLWKDAMVEPVISTDEQLKALGYSFEENNQVAHYYIVTTNANAAILKRDADNLSPAPWTQLQSAVEAQAAAVNQIYSMLKDPVYARGFSDADKDAVTAIASGSRLDGLKDLNEQASDTLRCIQYFTNTPSRYGLVPVKGDGGIYSWSSTDLEQVHHAAEIQDLSSSEQATVKSELKEMLGQVTQSESACVNPQEAAFIEAQFNAMNGAQK
jgi:hypothetical protein